MWFITGNNNSYKKYMKYLSHRASQDKGEDNNLD